MSVFASDCSVRRDGADHIASLAKEWEVWGPNGGFMAALALRTVESELGDALAPRSSATTFLAPAQFGELRLSTTVLRQSHSSVCVRVTARQDDRVVLESTVWLGAEASGAPCHQSGIAAPPSLGDRPTSWQRLGLLGPDKGIQRKIDERQVTDVDGPWRLQPADVPVWEGWLTFMSTREDGPFVRAARSLIALDIYPIIAALTPHPEDRLSIFPPTMSLTASFPSDDRPDDGTIFCRAEAPVLAAGYMHGKAMTQSEDGRVLAFGTQVSKVIKIAPEDAIDHG